jgi:3-deoxy-D-manno-octulosonic-acid transferase
VSAKKLILVRYDFLPEILLWSRVPGNELILIWASFKRKRLQHKMLSLYQQLFLKASKIIVSATEEDRTYMNKHGLTVTETFDFREIQILKRLESREQTLQQKFPQWSEFSDFLNSFHEEDKILFGNAWPVDLDLLSEEFKDQIENKEKLLVIVPHLVGEDHAQTWREKYAGCHEFYPHSSWSEVLASYKKSPAPLIIHLKGVLCELYHYFRFSYVGGGHGVSVHSLLEPFVSGSQFIACGPKVERSTEFDLSNQDYPVVSILLDSHDFEKWIKLQEGDTLSLREKRLENLEEKFHHLKKRLLAC